MFEPLPEYAPLIHPHPPRTLAGNQGTTVTGEQISAVVQGSEVLDPVEHGVPLDFPPAGVGADDWISGDAHDAAADFLVQHLAQHDYCVVEPPARRDDDFQVKAFDGIHQMLLATEPFSRASMTRVEHAVEVEIQGWERHEAIGAGKQCDSNATARPNVTFKQKGLLPVSEQ